MPYMFHVRRTKPTNSRTKMVTLTIRLKSGERWAQRKKNVVIIREMMESSDAARTWCTMLVFLRIEKR